MINDINIKRRNNLSLKLEAYKEIILNFETLLNIVNIGGATKDRFEAHAKLTNIIMTFGKNTSIIIELVNLNFPEIINKKSLKKTISKLSEIEELTNELRVSIEGEGIGGLFGSSALFGEPISPEEKNESIERDCQNKIFEWNEKVEPLIGELCILKKKFYKDLRNSLAL